MTPDIHRFEFKRWVSIQEAEMSLHVALFAVEGLYGEARVRLDAGYYVDEPGRVITVDATSEVGAAVARVYASLILHEFGGDAFTVGRAEPPQAAGNGRAA